MLLGIFMFLRLFLPTLLLGAFLLPASTMAAPFKTPHVEAELIARTMAIQPGQPLETALRLKIISHWHTYWRNPGDSGLPTKLTWTLPTGFSAGPIAWPYPKKLPLGPLMNFGYEGEVLHLVTLQTPSNLKPGEQVTLKAKAEWLVCNDVCIPENADLTLTLPTVSSPALADSRWVEAFGRARESLPKEMPAGDGTASIVGRNFDLVFSTAPHAAPANDDVAFFPLAEDVIANAGKQVSVTTADGKAIRLTIPIADDLKPMKSVAGILVSSSGWGSLHPGKALAISLPLSTATVSRSLAAGTVAPPSSSADMGLALALVFAVVGGMILNLMPCVFPVLGIKIMGFAQHAGSEPKRLRKQGLAFLAGILVSFWTLAALLIALRTTGEAVGWGFQLQSPLFVTFLAALFMLMALNLIGVFEMGMGLQAAAGSFHQQGSRGELTDAFLSGVLATVVATPCTAPMMGAALGYTLAQPAHIGMLVFTAIGIGMALPVLMLSYFPAWLRHLPKPGAWMQTLKQFLAFPLFATVVWLAWVLGSQLGNDAVARLMFGLVVVATGAWCYGRWQVNRPNMALVLGVLVAAAGLAIAWPEASAPVTANAKVEDGWVPFSRAKVASLREQNKAVFVDFTATWCITCQVNKRIALNDNQVKARFAALDIVRVKADWTIKDPEITAALAEFGRNGVPLYVYYASGGDAQILPEMLTPSIVLAALNTTIPAKTADK